MSKVPYANVVGCLMYSTICTRLDLAFAASLINRFMANQGREHWKAIKWVFRYVKGTTSYGLCFRKSDQSCNHLMGFW